MALLWDETVEQFLAHGRETPSALAKVMAADPDFAVAHFAKGFFLLLLGRAELVATAQDSLEAGRAALRRRPAGSRERLYGDGLAAWLAGRPRGAIRALETIIDDHPRDAFAIKLSHAIRFLLGDADGMRRSIARVVSVFTDRVPFAGYIRGCYAFALEETGDYAGAESIGRRAVELAPRDAWGRHAIAHVLEMTGRADEGVRWLGEDSCCFDHCNNFSFHIFWHLALFQLELGAFDKVLELYDHGVRQAHTDDYRDIANAASLLARLEIEGIDVGGRWAELSAISARRVDDRRLVFADLHYLLALLGTDDVHSADRLICNMIRDAGPGAAHDRQLVNDVGVPLAGALTSFRMGRFAETVALIGPVRDRIQTIGGSHAQRDVFEQIYLESVLRSGDLERAERLLDQREAARGGHNQFAARRLKRIAEGRSGREQVAARLIALTGDASLH